MPLRRSERLTRITTHFKAGLNPPDPHSFVQSNLRLARRKPFRQKPPPNSRVPTRMESARWDKHPERSTLFLQILADEKREGRLPKGSPSKATYELLSVRFWNDLRVRYIPSQFKNHYGTKKSLWSLICWARSQTGISWDNERRMILADPHWWEMNKNRKGLSVLEGKSIPDYDLLEFVYTGQHAEGAYLHDPNVPRFPLSNQGNVTPHPVTREEGIGVSSNDVELPVELSNPMNDMSSRKKKKSTYDGATKSTSTPEMMEWMSIYFKTKEEMKQARRAERNKTMDTATSEEPLDKTVMRILINEMGLDTGTPLFHDATALLENNMRKWALIQQPPEGRWAWLRMALDREFGPPKGTVSGVSGVGIPGHPTQYDVNLSPNK